MPHAPTRLVLTSAPATLALKAMARLALTFPSVTVVWTTVTLMPPALRDHLDSPANAAPAGLAMVLPARMSTVRLVDMLVLPVITFVIVSFIF
jgi:hypothetical protein